VVHPGDGAADQHLGYQGHDESLSPAGLGDAEFHRLLDFLHAGDCCFRGGARGDRSAPEPADIVGEPGLVVGRRGADAVPGDGLNLGLFFRPVIQ
jgi:hypothetical protein